MNVCMCVWMYIVYMDGWMYVYHIVSISVVDM